MTENPLVAFLASYGPSPSSDALADEHVQAAVARHGVPPIEAPAPKLAAMKNALLGDNPTSVILTGTAGDGKTYHIRKFFLDLAGGDPSEWPGNGGILSMRLGGRPLRIIRDLSQLTDAAKAQEIEGVTRCLLGEDQDTLYLVAANDGQLLKFWRDARDNAGGGSERMARYEAVLTALTDMLHRDLETSEEGSLRVRLLNLSRAVTGETIDAVLDGILAHKMWESGCEGCPQMTEGANPCPIQMNRKLLQGKKPDGADTFRRRLKAAIRIAALNDQHVPIRQILILAVNILLGDTKRKDRPLLNCSEARRRAKEGDYSHVNPFNNAVGLNVRPEKRRALTVFSAFESFGIGYETNTPMDNLLLDGAPADLAAALEARDKIYGARLFDKRLRAYKAGTEASADGERFMAALEAQRRRLFFLMDGSDDGGRLSPWHLTIFHHAGDYLAFADALSNAGEPDASAAETITKRLVKGINRTLTGMMVDETERVWLARSIGRAEGASGRFTTLPPVDRRGASSQRLSASIDRATGRPRLQVALRMTEKPLVCASLELRPLLFEYLMRVADGSLPSSFSRQCQQEVRHFALTASSFIQQYQQRFSPEDGDAQQIRILSVMRDGSIAGRDIGA
ncbi:hypothetical protein BLTE_30370 [Blastochloris tepida]|uniref:Uncharacterized protein n=2 Tax=Blastochloris tepida TaxID=2233851 RepID=A0A348G469_9HYPH|nr:hypothetical protein BLTE_30370 [Blastochloris tepida]